MPGKSVISSKWNVFILIFYLFIWKEYKRKDCSLVDSLSKWCKSQGWTRLKSGSRIFIQVHHIGSRASEQHLPLLRASAEKRIGNEAGRSWASTYMGCESQTRPDLLSCNAVAQIPLTKSNTWSLGFLRAFLLVCNRSPHDLRASVVSDKNQSIQYIVL